MYIYISQLVVFFSSYLLLVHSGFPGIKLNTEAIEEAKKKQAEAQSQAAAK